MWATECAGDDLADNSAVVSPIPRVSPELRSTERARGRGRLPVGPVRHGGEETGGVGFEALRRRRRRVLVQRPLHRNRTAAFRTADRLLRVVLSPTASAIGRRFGVAPRRRGKAHSGELASSARSGRSHHRLIGLKADRPSSGCAARKNNCEPLAFGRADPVQPASQLHSEPEGARGDRRADRA